MLESYIRTTSYDQHFILYNIMRIHNNGEPFECDMTYSKGKFYGTFENEAISFKVPEPKLKFDVSPQADDVVKIEPWGKLPLEDDSIGSIVIDLPFVISIGPSLKLQEEGKNVIAKRFGYYYPATEMYKSYSHWIGEAYRVLKRGGICIFKTQATVSGGIRHSTPVYSCMCALKNGFAIEDEFILVAKSRLISGKVKKQQHARNFHCHFFVFKKEKFKFNYFETDLSV